MAAQDNLELMKTLDDAWNAQDWDVFRKRHSADTAVYWPGQPDPTRGREAHQAESQAFFKSIENHLANNPYKVMIASGDCLTERWSTPLPECRTSLYPESGPNRPTRCLRTVAKALLPKRRPAKNEVTL